MTNDETVINKVLISYSHFPSMSCGFFLHVNVHFSRFEGA